MPTHNQFEHFKNDMGWRCFSWECMERCWLEKPDGRPSFDTLRQTLAKLLEQVTDEYSYLELNQDRDYYNVAIYPEQQATADNSINDQLRRRRADSDNSIDLTPTISPHEPTTTMVGHRTLGVSSNATRSSLSQQDSGLVLDRLSLNSQASASGDSISHTGSTPEPKKRAVHADSTASETFLLTPVETADKRHRPQQRFFSGATIPNIIEEDKAIGTYGHHFYNGAFDTDDGTAC